MFSIGDFFKRIQSVQSKEIYIRSVVQDVIKKHVGVEIPINDISFKSDVVNLKNISSAAKSALFIKRNAVIKEINEVQQVREVKDVR